MTPRGVAVYNDSGVHVVKSQGALKRAGQHPSGRQRAARHRGHRSHPVGHPWGPFRRQFPSPGQRRGIVRRGAQRHHRKLPVPEKPSHPRGRGVRLRHRHGSGGPDAGILLQRRRAGDHPEGHLQGGGQLRVGYHLRRLPGPHFRRAEGTAPSSSALARGRTTSPATCRPSSPAPGTSTG